MLSEPLASLGEPTRDVVRSQRRRRQFIGKGLRTREFHGNNRVDFFFWLFFCFSLGLFFFLGGGGVLVVFARENTIS